MKDISRTLADLDLLTTQKNDLDVLQVRFDNNVLSYLDDNTTRSIDLTKEDFIGIIDTFSIGGNGNDLFVQNVWTPMHVGSVKTILAAARINKFRENIIGLSGSTVDQRKLMVQILKDNLEPMWGASLMSRLFTDLPQDENSVFKFDTSGGTNKWSTIVHSSLSADMSVAEFNEKFEKHSDGKAS